MRLKKNLLGLDTSAFINERQFMLRLNYT